MSTYVMSDLHGCYDKFIAMLNQINFTEKDNLYILGDIFDRGPNPLGILDYIVNHKNITLIKGNHEKFFEEYYEFNDARLWYLNGGQSTHNQIMGKDFLYEESIYKYIKNLPNICVVGDFILVHAGLYFPTNYEEMGLQEFLEMQEEDITLWLRDNIGQEKQFKNYTIICGHTPVQTITRNYNEAKILKREGTIYIDCGCVFKGGKLTCLRLDDMREYYL